MATSEQSHTDLGSRQVTVRRVESVAPPATVRHIDQLEAAALEEFLALLGSDRAVTAAETSLSVGDVIVFTDYYRISSA